MDGSAARTTTPRRDSSLLSDRRGATFIEYAVIMAVMVGVGVAVFSSFGEAIKKALLSDGSTLEAASLGTSEDWANREAQANAAKGDPSALAPGNSPAMAAMSSAATAGGATPAPAPLPALQAGTTGLGAAVDTFIAQSADATANLNQARANGVKIVWGPAGDGSSMNRDTNTLTMDANLSSQGCAATDTSCINSRDEDAAMVLAHELGHATYTLPQPTGADYATIVNSAVDNSLADEGHAEVSRIIAQNEVLKTRNPPGTTTPYVFTPWASAVNEKAYQDIYDRLNSGAIDRKQADKEAGEVFRHGEVPSVKPGGVPAKDYDDYYRTDYSKQYFWILQAQTEQEWRDFRAQYQAQTGMEYPIP